MENKGYFIDEAENPGGNDWDMKNLFFILFYTSWYKKAIDTKRKNKKLQ